MTATYVVASIVAALLSSKDVSTGLWVLVKVSEASDVLFVPKFNSVAQSTLQSICVYRMVSL
jgi:hypothetical protein